MKKMKPILFNTEMVRAILDGKKTVTRRIAKYIKSYEVDENGYVFARIHNHSKFISFGGGTMQMFLDKFAPCQIGDILYVRETFADTWTPSEDTGYVYKADGEPSRFPYWGNASSCKSEVWRPSLHMPKEAARIFLKVIDVRVEQLRTTSIQDMINEGINTDGIITTSGPIGYRVTNRFEELWNSTIKKSDFDIYSFGADPWVWVIDFERVTR